MISEFTDLSDKIDRLAEMTLSLRRENATLRQSNAILAAENEAFMTRLSEAQQRVEALLATLPPEPGADPASAAVAAEAAPERGEPAIVIDHTLAHDPVPAVPAHNEAAQ